MGINVHFSSKRPDWVTPQDLFDRYDKEFDFDLDAAAVFGNCKVRRFIGPPEFVRPRSELVMRGLLECVAVDALATEEWPGERVWLNPPYGREIKRWYAAVLRQVLRYHKTVVMLVPARTDTSYWHRYVWNAERQRPKSWVQRIDFLKGRVKFDGAKNGAPFPSAVIVFRLQ